MRAPIADVTAECMSESVAAVTRAAEVSVGPSGSVTVPRRARYQIWVEGSFRGTAIVSVDAATKETYENVRRPGRWDVIRENLSVIGAMSRAGTFRRNRFAGGVQSVSSDLFLDAKEPAHV